jgi:hypothetical protein
MLHGILSSRLLVLLAALPLAAAEPGGPKRAMRVFDLRSLPAGQETDGALPAPPTLRARPGSGRTPSSLDHGEGDGFHLPAEAVAEVIREMIDPESWANECFFGPRDDHPHALRPPR